MLLLLVSVGLVKVSFVFVILGFWLLLVFPPLGLVLVVGVVQVMFLVLVEWAFFSVPPLWLVVLVGFFFACPPPRQAGILGVRWCYNASVF